MPSPAPIVSAALSTGQWSVSVGLLSYVHGELSTGTGAPAMASLRT
jgi:hypothetical protein